MNHRYAINSVPEQKAFCMFLTFGDGFPTNKCLRICSHGHAGSASPLGPVKFNASFACFAHV